MEPDPRVYFAAERTLLAWVRTGVAVIGLGFIVARLGVFVRMEAPQPGVTTSSAVSTLVGVALVLLASALTGIAAVQFGRTLVRLAPAEKPRNATGSLALLLALAVAAGGTALGFLLL
jgi:putative membrane protein